MTINVDSYGVQAPASGRQRLQTEARQDRWMYELEHAMLQSGKKPAAEGRVGQDSVADDSGQLPSRAREARRQDVEHAAGDAAAAVPAQQLAGAPATASVAAVTGVNAATAAAAAPAAGKAAAASAGSADAGTVEMVAAAAAGGGSSPSAPATQAGNTGAVASPAAMLAAYGAAGATLSAAGAAGADSADGALAPAAKSAAATRPGMAMASAEAQADAPQEALPESETPPASADSPMPPDGEEYASRLLHVYRNADGVQAWIRDASLGQVQAQQLAQVMAIELGEAGSPLSALTVNGRRLALPAGALPADEQRDDYAADAAAPAGAEHRAAEPINANGAA
jgi:hypothetical protein